MVAEREHDAARFSFPDIGAAVAVAGGQHLAVGAELDRGHPVCVLLDFVAQLAKKREAYIQAENKRLAEAGKGDGFDEKVAETIHHQAERKGINYAP